MISIDCLLFNVSSMFLNVERTKQKNVMKIKEQTSFSCLSLSGVFMLTLLNEVFSFLLAKDYYGITENKVDRN